MKDWLVIVLAVLALRAAAKVNDIELEEQGTLDPAQGETVLGELFWVESDMINVLASAEVLVFDPTNSSSAADPKDVYPYPEIANDNILVDGDTGGGTMLVRAKLHYLISDTKNTNPWVVKDVGSTKDYSVSGDGTLVAFATQTIPFGDAAVEVYEYKDSNLTLKVDGQIIPPGNGFLISFLVAFSPDDSTTLYMAQGNRIIPIKSNDTAIWPQEAITVPDINAGQPENILGLRVSTDGKWIILQSSSFALHFYTREEDNVTLNEQVVLLSLDETEGVSAEAHACFSPDSKYFVVPTTKRVQIEGGGSVTDFEPELLFIFDLSGSKPVLVFKDLVPNSFGFQNVFSCSFNPTGNGQFVVSQAKRDEFQNSSFTGSILRIPTPTPTPSPTPVATPTPTPGPTDTPTPVPTVTDNNATAEESACFPASATVELDSGDHIPMSQLRIGDKVRVSPSQFSPVFLWTHKKDGRFPFIVLKTKVAQLKLSQGHFVHTSNGIQAASNVQVGDFLIQGKNGKRIEVVGVESSVEDGLYNPQTAHGDIVVDGILSTTYTQAVLPSLAHALLSPLRLLYRVTNLNVMGPVLDAGSPFALPSLLSDNRVLTS